MTVALGRVRHVPGLVRHMRSMDLEDNMFATGPIPLAIHDGAQKLSLYFLNRIKI